MICNDFRNTYKSFLLILCGVMLAAAGADSGLALGIGLLLYFVFLMRFLNVLLYDAVLDSEGNVIEPCILWKKLICNKLIVMFSYSAIGEAVFLITLFLLKEYDVLEYRIPSYTTTMADSQMLFAFGGTMVYRIVSGVLPGLSLLAIMLICSALPLKKPRSTAWCVFWAVNLFLVPFVIGPCLNQGLSLMMSSAWAEKAAVLLLGTAYVVLIIVVLKKPI